jgi:hypothetical protein
MRLSHPTVFLTGSQRLWPAVRAALACAALALALPAAAQWGWKDASGRRVFSDQAPPVNVAEKDIFKRPAGSVAAPAAAAATAGAAQAAAAAPSADKAGGSAPAPAAAVAAASAPKLSTQDAELEKKKKEAEATEAAKKKAAEQEQAKARADNCERAKRALAQFNSGVRIATTNSKGEREFMSEAQRASETKRLQEIAAQDCKA